MDPNIFSNPPILNIFSIKISGIDGFDLMPFPFFKSTKSQIMNHTVGIRYLTLPPNRNFLASFERFHRLA